ncbi:MAG: ATP-binding protein, partial [Pseudomonadota bacterium]|nr:ATP-binding protein [Pseudomonadota bacterium]
DAEGRFTAVNDALYAMVGRPAGELIGRPYTDLVVPDALDDALRDRAALLRGDGGNTLAREYLCQTGSGECTWLSLNLSVVNSWVDGGAPYFVAVVQDVSRLRESREMLVRAQKMDVVGQLSGGIAHDFNNLLTVVIGNLQLVLQNDDPLKRMVRLNSALEAAERGAALTKRLLTFSTNDNPQLQLLDINAAIAGLVVLLEQSVGTVASLEFRPGADIWPVRIDPGRFESALLNLAVNARDAMASGGQLVIETRNVRLNNDDPVALVSGGIGPGHFVELAVSDSGSGMPADVRDRIFEPFFTTKSAGSGTGLGLTMVQRFVSDAGGAIKVYSAPGQGTTFRIYLPRAQLRQGERDPSSAEYPILRRGSETILVVDDDAAVREVATTVLTTLGYRTLEAASGEEAIDILVAHKTEVDLLFTDVVMGAGMNGTELAAAAIRINPRLRVLYTSGYTKDAFVARVTAEPVELLSKPYLSAELAQRIREVLDR